MKRIYRNVSTWIVALSFTLSAAVASAAEAISWRDLVPPFDDTLMLEGELSLGERVRFEMNNKEIRIPGFIVPVDFENRQIVTRFLIVPYFGACIHEPCTAAQPNYLRGIRTRLQTRKSVGPVLDRRHALYNEG
jgi:hypothetical protein